MPSLHLPKAVNFTTTPFDEQFLAELRATTIETCDPFGTTTLATRATSVLVIDAPTKGERKEPRSCDLCCVAGTAVFAVPVGMFSNAGRFGTFFTTGCGTVTTEIPGGDVVDVLVDAVVDVLVDAVVDVVDESAGDTTPTVNVETSEYMRLPGSS